MSVTCSARKIVLHSKKVCYKVSLYENCQRQSCKTFIGLTIRAKILGGKGPILRENLADTDLLAEILSVFARYSASVVTTSETSTG